MEKTSKPNADFYHVINERRSVRYYDPSFKIPNEEISTRAVEAGYMSEETKNEMLKMMKGFYGGASEQSNRQGGKAGTSDDTLKCG